jgi:hypothetical protein
MLALGGAVILHVLPLQVNAGKIVRLPNVLPWVLDEASVIW